MSTAYPYVVDTSGALDMFGVNVGYPTFTISAFLYRPQASSNGPSSGVMWSMSTGAPPYNYGQGTIKIFLWLASSTNYLKFGYAKTDDTGETMVVPTAIGTVDAWVYVATSYDGTKLKHYINGVLQAESLWPAGTQIASTNLVYAYCVYIRDIM